MTAKIKRRHAPKHWSLRQRLDGKSEWDPNTGCQLWFAAQGRDGYPKMGWFGKMMKATRLSLMDATGERGEGKMALHSCDTPLCINPNHLRWGTQSDNVADMVARGRMKPAKAYRKITPEEERAIISMHNDGATSRDIARDLGRSRCAVSNRIKRLSARQEGGAG